ncbi:MAG: class I SAM-dependent methyltransferase [Candidatus Methanoperedens sp.]|nr:class I SAM-dependent methyltransferase [Candidatus Methanoperedens sp.]
MIKNKLRNFAKNRYKSIIEDSIHEKIQNDMKILDIGAGNCWLLNLLSNNYTKIGIDLHAHQHFIDNTFIDFMNTKSSNFVFGDATNLPFPDATFDIVYSNEFVSHVNDIDETLMEQIRVLKKDGVLLIMDSNPINPEVFLSCFIINYLTSRNSKIKRGGMRWLFNRDEPFYELAPIKEGKRMVCWKDENIHTKFWWKKKLRSYSDIMYFELSNFWSYHPIPSFKLIANKILVVGKKL